MKNFQGTRDYFGDDARWRRKVIQLIQEVFESFGFEPLETPLPETVSTLLGKAGEESDQRFFRLIGGHTLDSQGGLRFDHTVPLARFIAMNWSNLVMPYRRYVVGPVLRNESTQAGRYRQFVQCDFDTAGTVSALADAEIPAINYAILSQLGFPAGSFTIQINDRRLLDAMVRALGVRDQDMRYAVFRAWDKLEKVSLESVLKELADAGTEADFLLDFERTTAMLASLPELPIDVSLSRLMDYFETEQLHGAVVQLDDLFGSISAMGVPESACRFNPLLARGLSYYTGPIFETSAGASIGSITGGGRYDRLIEALGGPDIPATGSSFGLERVLYVMEELGLRPKILQDTQVFCTIFDQSQSDLVQASFAIAAALRSRGFSVEVYTGDPSRLRKQLDVCNRRGIPVAIILGPDEINSGRVTVKNMVTGQQSVVDSDQLAVTITDILAN